MIFFTIKRWVSVAKKVNRAMRAGDGAAAAPLAKGIGRGVAHRQALHHVPGGRFVEFALRGRRRGLF